MNYLNEQKEKITIGLMQFEIDPKEPTKKHRKDSRFFV